MSTPITPSESQSQPQAQSQNIAIRSLYHQRAIYDNYPAFQRSKVWPERYKRALIDTILRGLPVPPILAFKEMSDVQETKYWIVDGQQRLSTVFEFMDGLFPTSSLAQSKKEEPNSLPPIEPRRFYNQLSTRARNIFNEYALTINSSEKMEMSLAGLIFRRWQNQQPLTTAEKLASYQSATSKCAHELGTHPIWTDYYHGPTQRKQTFQGALCLIVIEATQECVSMTAPRLKEYASGARDSKVTPELTQAITDRLDVVMNVFAGTTFFQREEIIPMYQAVLFLEKQGHQFTTSQKGCLTTWFGELQLQVAQSRAKGISTLFSQLVNTNMQKDFWEEQLPVVKAYCLEKVVEGIVHT
jgi:hypothetical protein